MKKENCRIEYCIDSIYKDEDKSLITIQGWAFETGSNRELDVEIQDTDQYVEISINKKYRVDIIEKYDLPREIEVGFFITLKVRSFDGKAKFLFKGESSEKIIEIKLSKDYTARNKNTAHPILLLKRGINYFRRNGFKSAIKRLKIEKNKYKNNYSEWIKNNETVVESPEILEYNPLFSVVMPVYNVDEKWLSLCIDSVLNQTYQNWELCIADDCSTKEHVRSVLENYKKKDSRIKVIYRKENGHICNATNSALEIATGEYIVLLDNDDELALNALYEVAKVINQDRTVDLIYSDEDKIDKNGKRMDPAFKSDWAPDTLLSTNYISHLGVYRKSIVEDIGGFRPGYEGAQDYDLVLRFTEKTERIAHIPKVLYHWRMLETSTAVNQDSKGYAFEAGLKALQDAINRRGIVAEVEHGASPGLYNVNYKVLNEELVSIIIPTRDKVSDIKKCIDSIFEKTSYENYEIIIADNGSEEKETLDYFKDITELHKNVNIVRIDIPFNFSKINNIAAGKANGKYLLFLNNDTEIINSEWLSKMVSFAQFKRIGAVGAKLYYPDNTIQHAGVIVGHSGVAGHGHCEFPRGDFGYFGRLVINCDYLAVTAACMMVKKEDFDAINGFEEDLSVAFNDVDFCIRLYELGKVNVWAYQAELYHYESKSRGAENTCEKQKRFDEEERYMYEHWKKYIENDPYYNKNLSLKDADYSLRI